MIIEFLGVPGSGKTYISYKLAEYINIHYNHYRAYNQRELLEEYNKYGLLRKVIFILPSIFNYNFIIMIVKILTRKKQH